MRNGCTEKTVTTVLKTRGRQGQPDIDIEQSEVIMKTVNLCLYYLLTGTKDDGHATKRANGL